VCVYAGRTGVCVHAPREFRVGILANLSRALQPLLCLFCQAAAFGKNLEEFEGRVGVPFQHNSWLHDTYAFQ
jgi:hypothetical protein